MCQSHLAKFKGCCLFHNNVDYLLSHEVPSQHSLRPQRSHTNLLHQPEQQAGERSSCLQSHVLIKRLGLTRAAPLRPANKPAVWECESTETYKKQRDAFQEKLELRPCWMSLTTSQAVVHIHVCPHSHNICCEKVLSVFWTKWKRSRLVTCMQETCRAHSETVFTEEDRGRSFITWWTDSHLTLSISKARELVLTTML